MHGFGWCAFDGSDALWLLREKIDLDAVYERLPMSPVPLAA